MLFAILAATLPEFPWALVTLAEDTEHLQHKGSQKDVVSLAKGIEAQVILLLLAGDLEENHSQFGSISQLSEETHVPAAGFLPAPF